MIDAGRTPRTLVLCFLGALLEGYDIQSMGVAAPNLAPALHLSHDQLGPVFSAATLGMCVGAIGFGRLADRFGRRAVLIVSLTIFGALTLATAAAPNLFGLVAIRVVAGLGLGGAMPNFLALAAEAVSVQRRGRAVAFVSSAMPLGGAMVSFFAAGLGWREIFVIGGAAPFALAAAMLAWLPESADFLADRAAKRAAAAPMVNWLEVYFGGGRAPATLLLTTAAFATLFSLYTLLNWMPILMGVKGFAKSEASLIQTVFNVGGVAGGFALATIFQGGRRAPMLAIWFAGSAAAVAALAYVGRSLPAAEAIGFFDGFFVSSASTALFAVAPDYYPVEMRAAGVGMTVGSGRLGATVGPLTAARLLAAGGATGALLALTPLLAVAAVAALTLLRVKPNPEAAVSSTAPLPDRAPA